MITDDPLPNWPPHDGEPIGEERARASIAWIRDQAPPLLARARRLLKERYPGATPETSAATSEQLSTWTLHERMDGLAIGCVWVSIESGIWAMVDIMIRRDGRLEARPGWNIRCRCRANAMYIQCVRSSLRDLPGHVILRSQGEPATRQILSSHIPRSGVDQESNDGHPTSSCVATAALTL